jgi:uncharacterized membrane protein (UPF0127 family)
MRLSQVVLAVAWLAAACNKHGDVANVAPEPQTAPAAPAANGAPHGATPARATTPVADHPAVVLVDGSGRELRVLVEVVSSPRERARGLMYRQHLPVDAGMLFLFENESIQSFWMKNTLIPLDIAYLDGDLRIVDIQQMEPRTTETHPSAAPAQYALEMNVGWFERNSVTIGDRIEF